MIRLPASQNTRVALMAAATSITMVGAAFAAVPLYNLFCAVTGYGGTTTIATGEAGAILDREMTVLFDANVNRNLGWEFSPVQRSMTVRVGETALAYYTATNITDHPITGVATFNVAPFKAASYFSKLECFCFTEQTLQPGETVQMPVLFFVDPLIDEERRLDDVHTMTLSYTFFESEGDAASSDAAP
ncbi:cytochrome c oxidase assembly protein [Maricaulis parjimensis]|uniref:cytochrome c oxidase assembly protein n=1 Tax=Maricaulis parjimensis TaxID=144023 RepID=UPI00193A73A8|nr:cytochrome c oxidase assembly protein [Maricaulis parjimensis]